MSPAPSTSAVVATFGRREMLAPFLDALLEDPGMDEVVVAVDGSDDGSFEFAEQRRRDDPRITPLWVDHRGQFGALDAGARRAHGEVLVFLDDDVRAAPDMISAHRRHHAEADRLVVLGHMPTVLPPGPSPAQFATVLYGPEYDKRCAAYDSDDAQVLRHLWGGNFSIRRQDYLALDYQPLEPPPDAPPLRMYHQDRDFGLRCLASGLQGRFDRRIRAVHRHERSVEGFLRDAYGQGACEVLLHHLHPEVLGPLDATWRDRGDRGPVQRTADRAADDDAPLGRTVSGTLRSVLAATASTGPLPLTVATARLARRVQQRRGAHMMLDLLADPGGAAPTLDAPEGRASPSG